jgi:hypothetical protein
MREPAAGDRLPAVLQFLDDESFSDVVIAVVNNFYGDQVFCLDNRWFTSCTITIT